MNGNSSSGIEYSEKFWRSRKYEKLPFSFVSIIKKSIVGSIICNLQIFGEIRSEKSRVVL